MRLSLYLFFTLTISLTFGASSKYNRLKAKLLNISKKIDQVQLQLNNSVTQLLDKIDDSTLDIISSISAARISRIGGKFSFSNI